MELIQIIVMIEKKINEIYTQWTSLGEFQSKMNDNIMIFKNSSSLINGYDFIATIYKTKRST